MSWSAGLPPKIPQDPDEEIALLLRSWRETLDPAKSYTARDLAALAMEHTEGRFHRPELRLVAMRVAGRAGAVSTKSFGRWLTSVEGRIVGGCALASEEDGKHGRRYTMSVCRP